MRRRLGAALEEQRVERLLGLDRAAAAQGATDVERVGEDEGDPDRDPQRRRRPPGERQGAREEGKEEEQVALQGRRVGAQLQPLRAAPAEDVDEEADQPHRQRGEQERRADDRPDRDLVGPAGGTSRATIAISVSGIAVPTAASTLPTAPSPSPSRWPIHSTALVKSSAPARMTAKLSASSATLIGFELRRAT